MQDGKMRHSGLGIISFAIGLAVAIFEFVLLIVAGVLQIVERAQPSSLPLSIVVVGLLTGAGVSCFCLGLSVPALFEGKREKLFSILGFGFNLIVIIVIAFLTFATAFAA